MRGKPLIFVLCYLPMLVAGYFKGQQLKTARMYELMEPEPQEPGCGPAG